MLTSTDLHINLWDLVGPLARTVDMMSPAVAEHHMRVAYLALRLSEELGFPFEERRDIAIAGALHDIGAFSLVDRLDLLAFEESKPAQHMKAGYLLLKDFEPFAGVAPIVRFHHAYWDQGAGAQFNGVPVPRGSHVLHLADRVSVLITKDRPILAQVEGIREVVTRRSGSVFVPEFVDALLRLIGKDYIWLEVTSKNVETLLQRNIGFQTHELDLDGLLDLSRLICRVIDFKSEFTAAHSSGVAATAVELARDVGFSQQECRMLEVAAFLHDLGKLAVPSEIIEKPGKLTTDEWHIMRTHVYYTYQVLDPIEALRLISSWGALHQERMNGSGYPFKYRGEDLPLGSRIMAIADVFTGITEDRPYRKGMDKDTALAVLQNMADQQELDGALVSRLIDHFDAINAVRAHAQVAAIEEYVQFRSALT